MNVRQMTRTLRICDHNATPVDVSIDFTGYGHEELGEKTIFFEIEQEQSVYLTIEGIEAVLEAAKRIKAEWDALAKLADKGEK